MAEVGRAADDKRALHCALCRDTVHQSFAAKRDTDHRNRWVEHHAREMARMNAKVSELQVELRDPEARVHEACERAEAAHRSRDAAMRALSYVEEIHHTATDNERSCTCGSAKDKCVEFRASAAIEPALRRWESRNVDRMNRRLAHGLPLDHPLANRREGFSDWHGYASLDEAYRRHVRFDSR